VSSRLSACLVYFLGLFVRIEYLTALLGFFLFGPALYSACLVFGPALFTSALPLSAAFLQQFWFLRALVRSEQFLAVFLPVLLLFGWFCRRNPLLKGKTLTWSKFLSVPKPKIWGFVGQKTQDNGINISMQGKVCG
jgi:hypothetical protein